MPLFELIIFGLMIFLASCGGRGRDASWQPSPNPESKIDSVSDTPAPSTHVLTDAFAYVEPAAGPCLKYSDTQGTLPEVNNVKIDGEFSDWNSVSPALTDPLGDAVSGIDFGTVAVARTGQGLALAISMQRDSTADLYFELGGILLRGEQLTRKLRRLFLWGNDGLYEFNAQAADAGKWLMLKPNQFELVEGVSGVELAMPETLLGDALSWPAFWIKIYTKMRRDDSAEYDASSLAVFSSFLHNEASNIGLSDCYVWESQNIPIHLRFVLDKATGVVSRHQINPRETVSNWALAAVRAGFDAASKILGTLELSTAETTIFLVNASGSEEIEFRYSTFRPPAAYDGLLINTVALAYGSTDYFPQGQVFALATAHAVQLHLLAHFPTAPRYLIDSVTQAIVDGIVQKTLGMSYWLDRYLSDISDFLIKRDDASPKPLSKGRWIAKEKAFAHLLGSYVEPVILRDAWIRAAALVRSGHSPDSALVSALEESALAPAIHLSLAKLWTGWVIEGSYSEGLGPEQVEDQDFDGLPKFLEELIGTRADRPDTDKDGWTDYAEFIGTGDPLVETSNPSVLIPDGEFSDWLELLPKKLIIDRGHVGSCPGTADISHFAAIAGHEELLIGGYASNFSMDDPEALWEVVIDLPNQKAQLLVSMSESSRRFVVKNALSGALMLTRERAPAMSRGTIEIPLNRLDLGLQPWTTDRGSLRMRLRTIYRSAGEEQFCDETGWFSPEFNQ